MAVNSGMAAMRPMERWIYIVKISQGHEGKSYSAYIVVYHRSGYRPRSGIKLVGKGGTEEEIEDNIPRQ